MNLVHVSENPKRKILAVVLIVIFLVVFFSLYQYISSMSRPGLVLVIILLVISLILLTLPLLLERSRPVALPKSSEVKPLVKPAHPLLITCPNCKNTVAGTLKKCPICGTLFPYGMGGGKPRGMRRGKNATDDAFEKLKQEFFDGQEPSEE